MDTSKEGEIAFRYHRNAHMGPRIRDYFRLLCGSDPADDGPEVTVIRAVLHGPIASREYCKR